MKGKEIGEVARTEKASISSAERTDTTKERAKRAGGKEI
jgi:hypothetical protein